LQAKHFHFIIVSLSAERKQKEYMLEIRPVINCFSVHSFYSPL